MTHCTLHLDHFVDCQNQFWPPIGALWQWSNLQNYGQGWPGRVPKIRVYRSMGICLQRSTTCHVLHSCDHLILFEDFVMGSTEQMIERSVIPFLTAGVVPPGTEMFNSAAWVVLMAWCHLLKESKFIFMSLNRVFTPQHDPWCQDMVSCKSG